MTVRLSELNQLEKDRLLQSSLSTLHRLAAIVEKNVKPGTRLQREVQELKDDFYAGRPFRVVLDRKDANEELERRRALNDDHWDLYGALDDIRQGRGASLAPPRRD